MTSQQLPVGVATVLLGYGNPAVLFMGRRLLAVHAMGVQSGEMTSDDVKG